jgi:hypothetical protein
MESVATIAAALIGGVIGSLGAQWLGERYRRQQAVQATRRAVAVRHLVQLQDALESLWFRIDNLVHKGGRGVMDPDYYETSSVYVLAYALAQERLLTIDGAFAELDVFGESMARDLDGALEGLQRALGDESSSGTSFYRYQRRALADLLLRWDGVWRTVSYAEFAELVQQDTSTAVIAPAVRFMHDLTPEQAKAILDSTKGALVVVERATGLAGAGSIAEA